MRYYYCVFTCKSDERGIAIYIPYKVVPFNMEDPNDKAYQEQIVPLFYMPNLGPINTMIVAIPPDLPFIKDIMQ